MVGNNKIVLLINGMRVNPPGGEELMIRSDVSVRFAEQIEIIYGPGSTLYGQDAISAVINIKTRSPGDVTVEVLGGYGLYDTKEGYASFARTFFEQSDLPVSVTGYVAARDCRPERLPRRSTRDWWQKYDTYLRTHRPRRRPRSAATSASTPSRGWSRSTPRCRPGSGTARAAARRAAARAARCPVLFFVPEARWRDRSLVVEGQHALHLRRSVALHSILTFNRYEVEPESRYVFPNGMGGLFLGDFKYAIGTSASVEEKLDVRSAQPHPADVRARWPPTTTSSPSPRSRAGPTPDRTSSPRREPDLLHARPTIPTSRVEINRAVDLQYQQSGAYAEGAHNFNQHLRAIAGVRVGRQHPLRRHPRQPARRPDRAAASAGG